MSDLVDPTRIEEIVGVERHPTEHYGRAVSGEKAVYVLHSQQCKDSTPDLRDCGFSIALDRGIEHEYPWDAWQHVQDRPVWLETSLGFLMPGIDPHRPIREVPDAE